VGKYSVLMEYLCFHVFLKSELLILNLTIKKYIWWEGLNIK
jgi:hypothetical protein